MSHRWDLPTAVSASGIVAVLRADAAEDYAPVCRALVAGGVTAIELTLTTPRTIETVATLRADIPEACIGVGTVLDEASLSAAISQGAEFIVTPIADIGLVRACTAQGIPIIPGALSPTEAHAMWQGGASAVKLFPAGTVGPGYIAQLQGPFPGIRIMPSGGVSEESIGSWIAAGAASVSMGSPLLGDAFGGGDLEALSGRAAAAVEAVRAARSLR